MTSATARTIGAVASIPVFAAAIGMSSAIASICATTNSGGTTWTPVTPIVFCAVSAVIALVPYTPWAANVLRSA
jgi:hypothetical protein